jgi:uncharacterized protein (TIGR03083 family)
METRPTAWIEALRGSHDKLLELVEPLGNDRLLERSYASEWSIAQVLSHLGSQAEIFNLFLDAGLSGEDPPGQDAFPPIWDAWNARSPKDQAHDALEVDTALVERFEALTPEQREQLHLQLFGMELDTVGVARMRLGEHAVHTWDVAVALDPAATVVPVAVALLIDTLGQVAARSGKATSPPRHLHVSTTGPDRHFTLELGEPVTLTDSPPGGDPPDLQLPAEAFIRLVYGRLDPSHTPPVTTRDIEVDDLRQVFPGF